MQESSIHQRSPRSCARFVSRCSASGIRIRSVSGSPNAEFRIPNTETSAPRFFEQLAESMEPRLRHVREGAAHRFLDHVVERVEKSEAFLRDPGLDDAAVSGAAG